MSENDNRVNIPSVDLQNGEPMSDIELSRLSELETVVEAGLQTFYEVGIALIEIRDSKLYRKTYHTFKDYCRERWGFEERHVYQLIDSAEIMDNLSKTAPLAQLPQNERQVRPLKQLPTEQQYEAWQRAVDEAGGIPSGSHVQRIVDDMRGIDRDSEISKDATTDEAETDELPSNVHIVGNTQPAHYHYDKHGSVTVTPFSESPDSFNYKRDMRSNQKADENVSKPFDFCQTPPYALAPLLPYLKQGMTIWEPAVGEGNIAMELGDRGFDVEISDILRGQNFFEYEPAKWDVLVTNPPYSLKYRWLKRCYELGKPFALLIPVETLGAKAAQELMQEYGFEIMLLNRRVSFKMPNKGWDGAGAQFSTMWFCWQVLPQPVMFGDIQYPSATEVNEDDEIH